MRTSRFGLNVNLDSKYHILKSVGIYMDPIMFGRHVYLNRLEI